MTILLMVRNRTSLLCLLSLRYVVATVLTSILIGCQSTSLLPNDANVSSVALDRVAQNLVYALVQIPSLNPANAKLQIDSEADAFGTVLHNRFADAGYDIQGVTNDTSPLSVEHTIRATNKNPAIYRYTVNVGAVRAERDYRREGVRLFPASRLTVSGVDLGQRVQLNDGIFGMTAARTQANASAEAVIIPVIHSVTNTSAPEVRRTVIVAETSGSESKISKAEQTSDSALAVKQNMYETRESNFADLLDGYDEVRKEILIFNNDSLFLGTLNKAILKELVRQYNPVTDLYSVIGCSHGNTNIENGNNVLAIGRANRVKEELVLQGVDSVRILDEGCWAPVHFDEVMPRRGVVLRLMRSVTSETNTSAGL